MNTPPKKHLILTVCGSGGGMYGPGYELLGERLPAHLYEVLLLDSVPMNIGANADIILDAIEQIGANYSKIFLIGWSMGGATVCHAAERAIANGKNIKGVVLISTQSKDIEPMRRLTIPLAFVHGTADQVLSHLISERLHRNYG